MSTDAYTRYAIKVALQAVAEPTRGRSRSSSRSRSRGRRRRWSTAHARRRRRRCIDRRVPRRARSETLPAARPELPARVADHEARRTANTVTLEDALMGTAADKRAGIPVKVKAAITYMLEQQADMQAAAMPAGISYLRAPAILGKPHVLTYAREQKKAALEALCLTSPAYLADVLQGRERDGEGQRHQDRRGAAGGCRRDSSSAPCSARQACRS